MWKNPWFMLILGLMVGLAAGYMVGERQAIRPAAQAAQETEGPLPPGHPPVDGDGAVAAEARMLQERAAELERLAAQSPDDPRLMVALGNLYFDGGRWETAQNWYERSLQLDDSDPNVLTDLAVVYRNLKQPDVALQRLDRALELHPEHWQAWYNRVVILHFDLHQHGQAQLALKRLQGIAEDNPDVPAEAVASLAGEVLDGE